MKSTIAGTVESGRGDSSYTLPSCEISQDWQTAGPATYRARQAHHGQVRMELVWEVVFV